MNDPIIEFFNNFLNKPGANQEDIERACTALNFTPPSDYLDALRFSNGGEGFINHSYLRLYSIEELLTLNESYQVNTFAPGLIIFGSTGGGEAYAFNTRNAPIELIQIPFIPLDLEYGESLGQTFLEFLQRLAENGIASETPPQINMAAVGKEVHEIHPVVFGGDPVSDKNKALVPSKEHAELCVFWNRKYQGIKKRGPDITNATDEMAKK
jgi:hypothetical protein